MRRLKIIGLLLVLGACLTSLAQAQTYIPFEWDGQKVMGRPVQFKDAHIQIAIQGGGLTNVPWGHLSQATLQSLLKFKNYDAYARIYIDPPPQRLPQGPRITVKEVARMERPATGSLGASPVMYLVFLLLYLANIYAGYEIAVYRQRNPPLVCTLAAVAPIIVPIVFLALPSAIAQQMAEEAPAEEASAEGEVAEAQPAEEAAAQPAEAAATEEAQPQVTVYARGQFTFNRRFFETKLAGFLKMVPGQAEKDMVVVISSARGLYTGPRLTRLSPNDLTLHVVKGNASQDVSIPFSEINEVKIRPKDAV
jgi:hypothetical protein